MAQPPASPGLCLAIHSKCCRAPAASAVLDTRPRPIRTDGGIWPIGRVGWAGRL